MKAMCFNKLTIVLITILSLFMGLVSCKEGEVDITPNYISALIGKWEVTVDEISDSYIVTFSSDKTALVESYKNMTKKDGECTVKWDVVKGSIVFEDGKAWFAF